MLSERAKKQWSDKNYKSYMTKKFKEFYDSHDDYRKSNNEKLNIAQKDYWTRKENREVASQRTCKFYEDHKEARQYLSKTAKEQWQDENLIEWRRKKTQEQWTPNFREKRMKAYNKTYFTKSIKLMKELHEEYDSISHYDPVRKSLNDKSLLTQKTFCERFFDGNYEDMLEAVELFNHKIKKIEHLNYTIDVYDLEVPGTHNFALASGVFVHNSSRQGRDRATQAILPIKGKILNVEKARLDKIFENKEVTSMITALGTSVGDDFDISKLRYHKIILMTDADVDGAHINCLLLTFFYRYMRKLIEAGHLYLAMPPLYKVSKNKMIKYAYNDAELKKIYDEIGKDGVTLQRYKGLGEMNAEQLWETTMDPGARILQKIFINDAAQADEMFSVLMGEDVIPRRNFILENAKFVRNLDI